MNEKPFVVLRDGETNVYVNLNTVSRASFNDATTGKLTVDIEFLDAGDRQVFVGDAAEQLRAVLNRFRQPDGVEGA